MRELDPITFPVAKFAASSQCPKSGQSVRSIIPRRAVDNPNRSAKGMCLILLAHGSKDPRWCVPFERIARDLEKELGKQRVRLAYMEFIEPTLMDVARECVQQMTLNIRVLPVFMAVGAHLATDIPEQVAQVRQQFPQIEVEVFPPIGEDARVVWLVEQIAIEAANR